MFGRAPTRCWQRCFGRHLRSDAIDKSSARLLAWMIVKQLADEADEAYRRRIGSRRPGRSFTRTRAPSSRPGRSPGGRSTGRRSAAMRHRGSRWDVDPASRGVTPYPPSALVGQRDARPGTSYKGQGPDEVGIGRVWRSGPTLAHNPAALGVHRPGEDAGRVGHPILAAERVVHRRDDVAARIGDGCDLPAHRWPLR